MLQQVDLECVEATEAGETNLSCKNTEVEGIPGAPRDGTRDILRHGPDHE